MNLLRAALSLTLFFCLLPAQASFAEFSQEEPTPVVVGGDDSYPPYEFIDEQGRPSGFNVELTRAIARVMGFEVEIRLGAWDDMRLGLAAGNIDILQGMVPSEERAATIDFALPHAVVHQSIWNRKNAEPVTSAAELGGKEVIVMRGSIMHDFMLSQAPSARLVTVGSLDEALRLLAAGRHDCALVAKLPGQYLIKKLGLSNIEPVARPLLAQDYGFAVRKGNRALLARFNEGLTILRETGEYREIHRKWLGLLEPPRIPWPRIVRIVAMVVGPLLLILGGIIIWNRALKKEVALRTEALEKEVAERTKAMDELKVRQRQLIQADKMTSLGILVSGVAHEVNNPTGMILLNLPHLQRAWQSAEPILEDHFRRIGDFKLGWLNYSRMRLEIPQMLGEMQDGAKRIKRIVEDLKDFARRDDADLSSAVDLNAVVVDALRLVDNSVRKATDRFTVQYRTGGGQSGAERLPGSSRHRKGHCYRNRLRIRAPLPDPDR